MGVQFTGTANLFTRLKSLQKQYASPPKLTVGYDEHNQLDYAMRVHEDLTMNHPRGGQAKFLEQPLRQYSKQIGQLIVDQVSSGRSLEDAMETGGLYLLSMSQPLVPVDSGDLVNSAFVRVDK